MRNTNITKKLVKSVKTFEFSVPYEIKADGNSFKKDDTGKVTTKLVIDYVKKEYHFDDGRYHLETSKRGCSYGEF